MTLQQARKAFPGWVIELVRQGRVVWWSATNDGLELESACFRERSQGQRKSLAHFLRALQALNDEFAND